MRLAVVFATLGRAETMVGALQFIREQTRQPDQVYISATGPADVPPIPSDLPVKALFGPKGLCFQRNTALDAIGNGADIVVFFDDDFAPWSGYLETLEKIFSASPEVVGVTGCIVADGIGGPGYTFDDARKFLAAFNPPAWGPEADKQLPGLYGCNMAYRLSAAEGIRFDEALPLYAWQEDVDFAAQIARRGSLVISNALGGVHLGVKRARTPGVPMGYSQIANVLFLRRKKTISFAQAYKLMGKNVAANLVRSLKPEPWCDRRGRLAGNMLALRDLLGGTLHPGNILKLK